MHTSGQKRKEAASCPIRIDSARPAVEMIGWLISCQWLKSRLGATFKVDLGGQSTPQAGLARSDPSASRSVKESGFVMLKNASVLGLSPSTLCLLGREALEALEVPPQVLPVTAQGHLLAQICLLRSATDVTSISSVRSSGSAIAGSQVIPRCYGVQSLKTR